MKTALGKNEKTQKLYLEGKKRKVFGLVMRASFGPRAERKSGFLVQECLFLNDLLCVQAKCAPSRKKTWSLTRQRLSLL